MTSDAGRERFFHGFGALPPPVKAGTARKPYKIGAKRIKSSASKVPVKTQKAVFFGKKRQ
jgi:hypothetical protein